MFANQGLYNGFLAAGLIWGLVLGLNPIGYMVQLFFVICVVIAKFLEVSHLINQLL